MKLYLAGPMRGYLSHNFPAFIEGAKTLRALGHEVWSPAEEELRKGFDPETDDADAFLEYMLQDLPELLKCDGIVMLGGWERSKGARLERHVAFEVGLLVFDYLADVPACGEVVSERGLK